MVIQDVVAQHAEEAAFLWTTRDRAVGVPRYSLASLAALDGRVEAHLDGLRIAGDAGWALCRANLENADASGVFPLAVLAFEAGDRQRMLDALTAGCISAETRRGLVSALGWLDYQTVAPWVHRLLDAKAAAHRAIGVAACAVQRQDPGAALTSSVDDPDPVLRSRALRAVGELKRGDLLNQVRHHLKDDDEQCRFWAAWTLTLCRDRAGLRSLAQWLGKRDRFGQLAVQLAVRAMSIADGRHWIRTAATDHELRRSAVIGAGTLGDPSCVPWLIGNMDSPELSRIAGEAFSMMTGVDLEVHDLDQDGPPDGDEADDTPVENPSARDADSHLPWPKRALVEQWWPLHHVDFQDGMRYLAGQPLTTRAARQVLTTGNQRQRAAAALELALREPEAILFEVRARGADQRQLLKGIAPT